jgi:hypothetical protein
MDVKARQNTRRKLRVFKHAVHPSSLIAFLEDIDALRSLQLEIKEFRKPFTL